MKNWKKLLFTAAIVKKVILISALIASLINAGCTAADKSSENSASVKAETKITTTKVESVKKEEVSKYLQVPSPEWKDQIIYFAMTDRFNDADPSNNDQGAGEYDPTTNIKYSGGDLKGVTEKIDYIKELGATAVWITPPIANQWWDPWVNYSGYHGYWAENFKEVDKHVGTLDDYKTLSATLHKNGMYLIQDIVCNHTGNFIRYKNGEYDPKDPARNFELNKDSKPISKPTQYPFSMNDVNKKEDKDLGAYHWTPDVKNFQDIGQMLNYQMSGLDDINTENPVVREAMRDSFNYWIKEVGVDAYRIDTVVYVEHDFWNDFINNTKDNKNPGIREFAKTVGKNDFLTFGETWVNVTPYQDDGDKMASSYIGTKEKPEMSSVLNFPLHIELLRVFGEGKPTSYLSYRLENMFKYYKDPYILPNFVDNHDMQRFLTLAPTIAVKQGLMFIMTIPGIPVIYYGTEQYLSETRASMFAKGFASGGVDHFDTKNDAFQFIKKMTEIRKENAVFRRGKLTVIKDNKVGTGAFAYKMEYEGKTGVVIFNTSDDPTLLDNLETGLPEGTKLTLLNGLLKIDKDLIVGVGGKISTILQPRAGMVFMATDGKNAIEKTTAKISIDNFKQGLSLEQNVELKGKIDGAKKLLLVVDGNIKEAQKIESKDGTWSANLPVESLENGKHTVVAYAQTSNKAEYAMSETYEFTSAIPFLKSVEYQDKTGDDNGPTGTYKYPSDISFSHQMDMEKVTVYKAGKNIKVAIKMAEPISTVWNPKYGFDHVSFNIYVEVPGQEGAVEWMPQQFGNVKAGMKWNYMTLLGGWQNPMYESKGSSPTQLGNPVSPQPKIFVNKDERTVEITLSGKAMGNPAKLEGIKLYVVTWDFDGMENGYRKLEKEPKAYIFGGAEPGNPYIMDDTDIIVVK